MECLLAQTITLDQKAIELLIKGSKIKIIRKKTKA